MNDQEIQNMEEEIDLSQYSTEEIEGMVLRTRDRKLAKIAELEASIASLEGDEKLFAETLRASLLYEVEDIRNMIEGSVKVNATDLPEFTPEMEAVYEESCLKYVYALTEEEAREEAISNQVVQGAIDSMFKEIMSKVGMDILNHPKLARSVVADTDIPWMLAMFVMGNPAAKEAYYKGTNLDRKDIETLKYYEQ
ncbi:MAG: hypothetical protein PUK31_03490 [Candidatus Methanomethylophilaceae archaeon]|nr:hypothetical protein [Candidatus Methanomethylophilaceae archaeon]MDY5871632.1 hypothetical protein [Candidatus Methanomethylophilaceae archaeon]